MCRPELALAGLSQGERGTLFKQLAALDPDAVLPLERARFGDAQGWLISDGGIARKVLTGGVGVKSRPAASQIKLGGIGAQQGARVRSLKRELLVALGSLAGQDDLVAEHVAASLNTGRGGPLTGLTEALTAASISLVVGGPPGFVSKADLRERVMQSWQGIEDDGGSSLQDSFYDYLQKLVSGASESKFLSSLAADGWPQDKIVEELRAMVLAGWGSTAAVITSAVSLGVAGDLRSPFILDEVLRLYPPSFMIGRTATGKSSEFPFKSGETLLISPWLIHRSSRAWASPLDFRPGRWADRVPGAAPGSLPFGLGPRRCPASRFARTQATVTGDLLSNLPRPHATEVTLLENRSPALSQRRDKPDSVRSVPERDCSSIS